MIVTRPVGEGLDRPEFSSNLATMTGPVTLSTSSLHFRPVEQSDTADLFDVWTRDLESVRYIQWGPHQTFAEASALVNAFVEAMANQQKSYYMVSDASRQLVGFASLSIEDHCRAQIGFVVFTGFRRLGYATRIISALCNWSLTQPAIFRAYALCDTENVASMGALEKAGFSREGVLRRWAVHPNLSDKPRDVVSFAKTRPHTT